MNVQITKTPKGGTKTVYEATIEDYTGHDAPLAAAQTDLGTDALYRLFLLGLEADAKAELRRVTGSAVGMTQEQIHEHFATVWKPGTDAVGLKKAERAAKLIAELDPAAQYHALVAGGMNPAAAATATGVHVTPAT